MVKKELQATLASLYNKLAVDRKNLQSKLVIFLFMYNFIVILWSFLNRKVAFLTNVAKKKSASYSAVYEKYIMNRKGGGYKKTSNSIKSEK